MPTPGGDLVRAMAGGDREAFARFYDRYAVLVFPLVLRIVRDRADAVEVLQDVFWEAWRAAAAYDPARGTAEAWILTRARTRAIDHLRAAARDGDTHVSHEPFETLAAVYAVGALDGDDLAQFEAHLPTCAVCQAALREAQDALARAMLSTPPQAPPAQARAALVRRVGRARGADRRSWLTWAAATAVVAAAAAGFTGTWVAVRYEARLGQMARETAAVKERLARNEASLRDQVTLYRGAVELLRDPATRVVDLGGQGPAAAASGRMIWNDAGGGHLFVAGLPPTPAGKTYALWTIGGGIPRPAGLFGVDAAGRATHRIAPASAGAPARVFAVTVEPEGGVPTPTGPIVLASK